MTAVSAYPLSWPAGWKRTPAAARANGKFSKQVTRTSSYTPPGGTPSTWKQKGDISIAEAVSRLRAELARMGVRDDDLVISTNLQLRLDGLPKSAQRQPEDPGAAVYWRDGNQTRCMAIDRYHLVEHNLAAVAATLDAMRAIERHGGAEILDRAFSGFAAIAPPASTAPWRVTLGFETGDTVTSTEVERRFREAIKGKHPDQGGDPLVFAELVAARDAARLELCYETDQTAWGK